MAELHLAAVVSERGVDVALDVGAGEVLAVLGPNGAGKSTALHVIAGLVRPDTGVVRVGGRTLTDTAAGVQVATHDRRVGLLMQDPLLFPHLSVQANVAFPLRSRGIARPDAARQALHWLGEVGAADLADRRPGELSGGQAQRVAIARALAAEPDVLLLDEPLAGLDVAVAASVRSLLQQVVSAAGRATVLITHDLLDVLALADRVLVLEAGQVAEAGPVAEVLAAPRSRFGARFAGVNLVRGTLDRRGNAAHSSRNRVVRRPDPGLGRRRRRSSGVQPGCGRGLSRRPARQPAQLRRGSGGGVGPTRCDGPGAGRGAVRRRARPGRRHHRRGRSRAATDRRRRGVVHRQGPGGRVARGGAARCEFPVSDRLLTWDDGAICEFATVPGHTTS